MTTNNLYFLRTDPTFNPFLTLDHALTPEECQQAIDLGESFTMRKPVAGKDHRLDVGRSCWLSDIEFNGESAWLYQRVMDIFNTVNYQSFNYDITGLEGIQYSRYDQPGDQYGRHMDMNTKEIPLTRQQRKLGFSIFLDRPENYEGGHFLGWDSENKLQINQPQGSISIYPSWLVHQITPMEKGVRRSIDGWFQGPVFR